MPGVHYAPPGQEAVSQLAGPPSSLNPAAAHAVSSRTAANAQLGGRLRRSAKGRWPSGRLADPLAGASPSGSRGREIGIGWAPG